MDEAALLMEAVTKEDRQFLLEHFFHKVFSDVCTTVDLKFRLLFCLCICMFRFWISMENNIT